MLGRRRRDVLPTARRPRTRTRALSASRSTPPMRWVLRSTESSSEPVAAAPWPVPCGATRSPCSARGPDDRNDVVGRLGQRDRRRPLVDGQVPGQAGFVPLRVVGVDEPAVEMGLQGFEGTRVTVAPGWTSGRVARTYSEMSAAPVSTIVTARTAPAPLGADGGLRVLPPQVLRRVPPALRRRGDVQHHLRLALRDALRPRAGQGAVQGLARAAARGRGQRAARPGRRAALGAPARRRRAPAPPPADAAAVPRPADGGVRVGDGARPPTARSTRGRWGSRSRCCRACSP